MSENKELKEPKEPRESKELNEVFTKFIAMVNEKQKRVAECMAELDNARSELIKTQNAWGCACEKAVKAKQDHMNAVFELYQFEREAGRKQ